MELADVFNRRQSQRAYTGEKPSDAQLEAILHAAQQAPVAMGRFENYHLTVIQSPELLADVEKACGDAFHRHGAQMLYGAPVFVLVSASGKSNADYSSAAIIAHSMALTAVDQNVGYCYIWGAVAAIDQTPELLAKLQLPAGFTPTCGIVLGQSTQAYAPREFADERVKVTRL
ncbi:nitroreductase family protein [Lacticaseibacillus sp. GG6-2]